MKTEEVLYVKRNLTVLNVKTGNPFIYEYTGEEVDFLNLLLERKELIPENVMEIGKITFDCRSGFSGLREDGSVQLGYHKGFGSDNCYIIVPTQKQIEEGKKIRVFSGYSQPNGAIIAMIKSFVSIFERSFPFKEDKEE